MKRSILLVDDKLRNVLTSLGNLAAKGAVGEVQTAMNQIISGIIEEECPEIESKS